MQDIRKTIVEALNGTSSQAPMSLKDICDKSGITLAQANPLLDVLYEDKVVNKATVIRAGITQIYYWQTAKALTPSAWSSFTFSPKAPSNLPPPARRNEVKPSPPINKENEMSRSDVIRNAIKNNPGIAHDELIAKISPSNHPADLKKSADLLEYVMRQGGFERTKDIRTGTNDIIRKYYTTQAWQQRIESAKQVVENTIPTLQQHHDAAPAKQINEQCEPIMKQVDDHTGNANKMMPALQQTLATIEIKFAIQLPEMPDKLKLTGLRKASLDDAIASGEGYMIDVATLDDSAVESLCAQWAQKFKTHVQARRESN